jgi:hypothetical protein
LAAIIEPLQRYAVGSREPGVLAAGDIRIVGHAQGMGTATGLGIHAVERDIRGQPAHILAEEVTGHRTECRSMARLGGRVVVARVNERRVVPFQVLVEGDVANDGKHVSQVRAPLLAEILGGQDDGWTCSIRKR